MAQFESRNITMMMDLYELTMAYGYFREGEEACRTRASFDVLFRLHPDGGGFSIYAGTSSTTSRTTASRATSAPSARARSCTPKSRSSP